MTAVRVVCGALIVEQRVLVAQRSTSMHFPGLWELPGGKVEPGEADNDALIRELQEELNIEVRVLKHLETSRYQTPGPLIDLVAYHCEWAEGALHLHEHSQVRWLSADQLQTVQWAPADEALLDPLAKLLRRQ